MMVRDTANQGTDTMSKLWKTIVEVYTTAELTYGTDKLMALSGVSKIVGRSLGDEYCAGLWRKSLVTDLFWFGPSPSGEKCSRPSPYRAPSWSWANMDGQVSFSFFPDGQLQYIEPLVNILTCEVETATGDPFRFVTDGFLKLSGLLATIQIQLQPDVNGRFSLMVFGGMIKCAFISVSTALPQPITFTVYHCSLIIISCQRGISHAFCLNLVGRLEANSNGWAFFMLSRGQWECKLGQILKAKKNGNWLEYESRCDDGGYVITIL